ncbi:MAG: hypothetical protein F6K47_07455 [Symploca sp. SIO2E6]|nr:hypothetical protein [Symploca sp. SIO2E6]
MTNKNKEIEVTILCEDIAHERFITQYLIKCGFDKDKIKDFDNPKGRKINNNNDFILKHYASVVKSYRSKNFQNRAVVVMIDADERSIDERIRELNIALDKEKGKLNQDLRLPKEKIAIFVPARNIETLLVSVTGKMPVPQGVNEENLVQIRYLRSASLVPKAIARYPIITLQISHISHILQISHIL